MMVQTVGRSEMCVFPEPLGAAPGWCPPSLCGSLMQGPSLLHSLRTWSDAAGSFGRVLLRECSFLRGLLADKRRSIPSETCCLIYCRLWPQVHANKNA